MAERISGLSRALAQFVSRPEFRERRRALLAAVTVAAAGLAGRALLLRLLPGAELTGSAVAQELLTALCALALVFLVAALHPLPAVLVAVAYALYFAANLEMLAAMDTFIEVQDVVFAADEVFLTGSAAGVQFLWFGAVFALVCGLFAVAAGRAQRELVRRSRARSRALVAAGGGALLAIAGLLLMPTGLTWQEEGVVAGSVRASAARAGIGRTAFAAPEGRPAHGPSETATTDDELDKVTQRERGELDGELIMPRAEDRHNVLLVIIEGIPGVYLSQVQAATAVEYPVVMGRFSEIAERGLIATQSVAHARQTIRGLYSALTGDYPRLDLSTPKIYPYMQADAEVRPPGLAAVMNSLGYRSIYLQAADLSYMSKDRFMPEVGFEEVLGKEYFEYSHVPFDWGPDDKAYFEQVAEFIGELEAERRAGGADGTADGDGAEQTGSDRDTGGGGDRPWFLTLLTVGTHHPYGVTDEYAADFPSRKIASVAYLDEALGEFFDTLEAEGHLEDTAVFIVSDESHGVTGHPFGRYWGSTVIRTPELSGSDATDATGQPGGEAGRLPIIQDELVGLRDVPISILDYLREDEQARAFAGRSFLRRYQTPRKLWFGPYVAKQSEDSSETTVFQVPDGETLTRFIPATGAAFAPEYHRRDGDAAEEPELAERLHRAYIAATHIPGVEYAIATDHDEIVEPDDPREQHLVLIDDASYRLEAGESKMLTSAQYLEIPADTKARLDLELATPSGTPAEALLRPRLQVLAAYEEVDLELPPMPELRQGEVFELSVSFRTPEKLERVWVDLRALSLPEAGDSKLEVRDLSLELMPLPDDDPGPDALDPRVRRFEVRPRGTASAADAARRGGTLLPVAHAGGRYAGTTYTNSVEALEAHAEAFQVFEIDFEWTADGRLVGLHDWEVIFERLYGFRPDEPLGYEEFRALESPLGVTPVDLDLLREFLHRHPRAAIVTDVKTDNLPALEKIAERIEDHGRRIIPQVYRPEEFAEAAALGYERIIWTLYRFAPNRNPDRVTSEARALAEEHGEKLLAVAMPVVVAEDGTAARLAEHGIPSYAHTINSCDEYNRLRELGVASVYTDDLAVEDCAPDSDALSVLSFNVRLASAPDGKDGWEHRREMVFEVIADHDPDLIGLQEPELVQIHELAERFPEYSIVGRSSEDGAATDASAAAGKFNAVMVRTDRFELADHDTFWFSEAPDAPGSRSWGAALPRICTWVQVTERETERTIFLYNLHLDYASQEARENSTALLLEQILQRDSDGIVLITGDFNANELNPAVRLLLEDPARADAAEHRRDPRPLRDTFRAIYPHKDGKGEMGTFHGFSGEPRTTKIDFVLAPDRLEVTGAGIDRRHRDGRYPSDHFPVYAELRLPGTD